MGGKGGGGRKALSSTGGNPRGGHIGGRGRLIFTKCKELAKGSEQVDEQ